MSRFFFYRIIENYDVHFILLHAISQRYLKYCLEENLYS